LQKGQTTHLNAKLSIVNKTQIA